jgi:hypothetical protein
MVLYKFSISSCTYAWHIFFFDMHVHCKIFTLCDMSAILFREDQQPSSFPTSAKHIAAGQVQHGSCDVKLAVSMSDLVYLDLSLN